MSGELSPEMRGFDDATNWLLDLREDPNAPVEAHFHPPEPIASCDGDTETGFREDCPRCQYKLGWLEGVSK